MIELPTKDELAFGSLAAMMFMAAMGLFTASVNAISGDAPNYLLAAATFLAAWLFLLTAKWANTPDRVDLIAAVFGKTVGAVAIAADMSPTEPLPVEVVAAIATAGGMPIEALLPMVTDVVRPTQAEYDEVVAERDAAVTERDALRLDADTVPEPEPVPVPE